MEIVNHRIYIFRFGQLELHSSITQVERDTDTQTRFIFLRRVEVLKKLNDRGFHPD
jgi:hypothetical protein